MAQIFDFHEARKCIEPVIALASETGDKKRFAQMQSILGSYHHWVREDFANAFVNLEEAARTSSEIGDIVSIFFSNQWLGYAYGFCCQFHKAAESLERALEINTALDNLWGVCAVKASIAYCVHLAQGDISRGYETTKQTVSIAEKSGDIYSKAIAYVMHGFSSFQRGLFDEAGEYLTKGIEFSEKTNFGLLTAHGRFTLGHVHFVLKRYEECIDQYAITEQIWKLREALPSLVRYIQLATILARVCSEGYKVDWQSLFQLASQNRLALHEGSIWRCVSNILIHGHGGGLAEAERAIERAMEADVRNGTKWSLGMDHATYAQILTRKHLLRVHAFPWFRRVDFDIGEIRRNENLSLSHLRFRSRDDPHVKKNLTLTTTSPIIQSVEFTRWGMTIEDVRCGLSLSVMPGGASTRIPHTLG